MVADYLSASWMQSANAQKWAPVIAQAESDYGIPSGLLARIAYQESSFIQSNIDGTNASSAGALGIMQLKPAYFESVRRPIPFNEQDTIDQINQAAQELARLYGIYGNWTYVVAAYNDGEGNLDKILAHAKAIPIQTADYLVKLHRDLPNIVNATLQA